MGFPYPYPLGLPRGTVRATIALSYAGTLAFLILNNNPLASKLGTSVAITIAFYFGGRVRGTMPAGVAASTGERAFGLPSKSVRTIFVFLFTGLWLYLFLDKQPIPSYLSEFILMIWGYLVGNVFFHLKHLLFRATREKPSPMWFEHLKALVILGFSVWVCASVILGVVSASDTWVFSLSYLTIGFYYGERR